MDGYSTKYGDQSSGYAGWTLQKSLPTDEGFGYRMRATTDERAEAGVGYASPYGVLTAEAATSSGTSATRASSPGGIGYIEGRTFASRAIVDSFALVRVATSKASVSRAKGIRLERQGRRHADCAAPSPSSASNHDRRKGVANRCRFAFQRIACHAVLSFGRAGGLRCGALARSIWKRCPTGRSPSKRRQPRHR